MFQLGGGCFAYALPAWSRLARARDGLVSLCVLLLGYFFFPASESAVKFNHARRMSMCVSFQHSIRTKRRRFFFFFFSSLSFVFGCEGEACWQSKLCNNVVAPTRAQARSVVFSSLCRKRSVRFPTAVLEGNVALGS